MSIGKRIAIGAGLVAILVVALVSLGSGSEDGKYQVRAIFRNASFVIPGEDVKVAGAKVGSISDLDVTEDGRAVLVLNITDPAFKDFRQDAECIIRLQSVIGEKLVECEPTQPHPEGAAPPPPLEKIPDGEPGAGQYLLPMKNTVTPVDVDLLNDIQRLPYRQRLTILLNEFGAGVAGRGEDLRKLIRDADPALKELDKVLKILADQNRILRDLAVDGDRVLSAWAKKRKETADFIVQANTVAQATAERGDDLEKNFERFPAFLRQLTPTMKRLGAMSDEMTPVVTDLGANGSKISRFLIDLGPFARNAVPAFRTLGDTSDVGGPALQVAQPLIQLIARFASTSRGLSANLKSLAVSLKETETIQRAMDVIYYVALAANGYDQFGHYFRTSLLNDCTAYRTKQIPNSPCNARFSSASSSAAGVTPLAEILRTNPKTEPRPESQAQPEQQAPPAGPDPSQPVSQGASADSSKLPRSKRGKEALLDYLLGSESR